MKTILFLCPQNNGRSVIAAAYFDHMVAERGLTDYKAASAGTEPSASVAPKVAELLEAHGFDVWDHLPWHATLDELQTAYRVISMGCDVSELAPGVYVKEWNDVPAPGKDLLGAWKMIRHRVGKLVDELASQRD